MYDVRLGSYSIAATFAGMSSLRRLKSIRRYRRLAPPPRWREVLRPYELRPPLFLRPSVSDFSGVVFVISAKSGYETKRIPGEVGLGLRVGIRCSPPGSGACGGAQGRAGRGRREGDVPLAHDRPRTTVRRSSCASSARG